MGVPDATGNKCHAAPTICLAIPTTIYGYVSSRLYTFGMDSRKRERGKGKKLEKFAKAKPYNTYYTTTTAVRSILRMYVVCRDAVCNGKSTRSGGDAVLWNMAI